MDGAEITFVGVPPGGSTVGVHYLKADGYARPAVDNEAGEPKDAEVKVDVDGGTVASWTRPADLGDGYVAVDSVKTRVYTARTCRAESWA